MEHPVDTIADFVARGSPVKLLLRSAGSFVCVGFALWWLGAFGQTTPNGMTYGVVYVAALVGGTIVFGFYGLLWLVRSFQPREELRIGAQGFYWKRWSQRTIPWYAIAKVAVRRVGFTRHLVLNLHDRDAFPPHGANRIVSKLNRSVLRNADVTVDTVHLDRTQDEVMQAFFAFCPTGVLFESDGQKPERWPK